MTLKDFTKGSSLVATIPTLLYIGFYQRKNRISLLKNATPELKKFLSIPFETLVIGVLFAYGIAYSSLNYDENEQENRTLSVVITGSLLGLSLSLIGRFVFDLPVKMFGITPEKAWIVHPTASILYIFIFLYVDKVLMF